MERRLQEVSVTEVTACPLRRQYWLEHDDFGENLGLNDLNVATEGLHKAAEVISLAEHRNGKRKPPKSAA